MEAKEQLAEVQRLARALYGEQPSEVAGALHVFSAVRPHGAELHVVKINARAPKSATDFFVLNFWRAHCDAILTTAQVVRAEPQLSHELQGSLAQGLAAYRSQALGKPNPPWCAVLTRSGDVPATHRMFADALDYIVLSPTANAPELTRELAGRAEVVAQAELGVRSAIAFMRTRGARTILIEAGPSTAGQLYSVPRAVDHLMLSLCTAQTPMAAVGGALPSDSELLAGMTQLSDVARDEESGVWRFKHFVRTDHKR